MSYNRVPALHHINLEIGCGHCVALLGPNGAGKTTFSKPSSRPGEAGFPGSVTFHGHQTGRKMERRGSLPAAAGKCRRLGFPDHRARAGGDGMLPAPELVAEIFRRRSQKSGRGAESHAPGRPCGSGRSVAALRRPAAAGFSGPSPWHQEAHIFLFDEPFADLDKQSQEIARAAQSKSLAQKGKSGDIASHHDLERMCRIFLTIGSDLPQRRVLIAYGDTSKVFTEENIAKTFSTSVFSGAAAYELVSLSHYITILCGRPLWPAH